jgi:hypothetical protein
MSKLGIAIAIISLAACTGSQRGTTELCMPCTDTTQCTQGLFCGPEGVCTTNECSTVGCMMAPGFVTSCVANVCSCSPGGPDLSASVHDLSSPQDLSTHD